VGVYIDTILLDEWQRMVPERLVQCLHIEMSTSPVRDNYAYISIYIYHSNLSSVIDTVLLSFALSNQ
jgi:hypothetical protein